MKNKKFIKVITITTLIATIFCTSVFAKQITETISVIYDNIKIIIDGSQLHPTDVNGNTVEPFIYNGTTYLPVRAIANAFNKEVGWNPETMTVTLGSQEYDWLHKMSYIDHQPEFCSNSQFTLIDDGIRLYQTGGGIWHEHKNYPKQTIAYKLNNEYTNFAATLYSTESNGAGARIKFYGDNKKLIHAFPAMDNNSMKLDVEIDVSGQNILYIEVENIDFYEGEINFANARLLK